MVISARYFYHFGPRYLITSLYSCICVDTHRKVAICDGYQLRLQRQVTTYEESHRRLKSNSAALYVISSHGNNWTAMESGKKN